MSTRRSDVLGHISRVAIIALFCVALVSPTQAVFTLDATFNGGKVTVSFPNSSSNYTSQAFRVFVQPGGRILLGGSFTNGTADGQLGGVASVGLTQAGELDAGYGSGGRFTAWRSDANTNPRDALMYPDGSTLYITQVFRLPVGSSTVEAFRLSENGGFDSVFAANVSIGPCCIGFFNARPVQIAVQSDGKILALITDQGEYFLYRLNADGTRDTTFGNNGVAGLVFNKFSPNLVEMIALNDGKILFVGHVAPFDTNLGSSELFFARLTQTGSWDKTFGRAGMLRVPFASGVTGIVRKAIVQSDGKILLSGNVVSSDADVWVARFRPNGRRDTGFGENGVVIHDFSVGDADIANSIAISADGKIRIAGQIGQSTPSFLVARFSANGTLEDQTSISFTTGQYAVAQDIALQQDGKLLVAGYARNPNMSITGSVMAIARFIE